MKVITILTLLFASFYYAVTAATLFRLGNTSYAVSKMRKKDWISKDADGEVPDDETIPASSKLGLSVFNSLEALKKKFPNAKDKCIWTADSTGLGTDFVSVETAGKDGHIYLHPTGHHHSTAKELKTFLNEKFTKHAKRQVLRWERSEVGMLEDRDESLC